MHSLTRNPIALRLERTSRWPSETAARWLGVGSGVVIGFGSGLISARFLNPDDWSIRLGSEPLVVVVCLTISFVLSAVSMAGAIHSGDYALLRLSSLPAFAIVDGYTEGLLYRLRLLRAVAVWSPAGWAAWLLLTLPPNLQTIMTCGMAVVVGGVAVAVGQMIVRSLSRLMVSAGVWFALRLGARAGVLAAGVGALAGSALVVSLGAVFAPGLFRCCAPMLAVAGLAVLDSRRTFFHSDAIRVVESKSWLGRSPEEMP
jgi:hypothetical protein